MGQTKWKKVLIAANITGVAAIIIIMSLHEYNPPTPADKEAEAKDTEEETERVQPDTAMTARQNSEDYTTPVINISEKDMEEKTPESDDVDETQELADHTNEETAETTDTGEQAAADIQESSYNYSSSSANAPQTSTSQEETTTNTTKNSTESEDKNFKDKETKSSPSDEEDKSKDE